MAVAHMDVTYGWFCCCRPWCSFISQPKHSNVWQLIYDQCSFFLASLGICQPAQPNNSKYSLCSSEQYIYETAIVSLADIPGWIFHKRCDTFFRGISMRCCCEAAFRISSSIDIFVVFRKTTDVWFKITYEVTASKKSGLCQTTSCHGRLRDERCDWCWRPTKNVQSFSNGLINPKMKSRVPAVIPLIIHWRS